MITAAQLRAARGLMDWSRSDLSKASNVSPETIKNIEHGTFRPQETTADAIVRAFASEGIEFIENNGVRQMKDTVLRLEGTDGFKKFVDHVYLIAQMPFSRKGGDKPICASNFSDELFAHHLGEYLPMHIDRMNKIQDLKVKILAQNNAEHKQGVEARGSTYRECRQPQSEHSGDAPFYVYGDNLAILVLDGATAQIVVISSPPVAKAYRQHFNAVWEHATPVAEK